MLRSSATAFVVTGLVIGLLLAVGTRPATSDTTRVGAPPTVATSTSTTTSTPSAPTSTTLSTTPTTSSTTTSTTTTEATPTTVITGSHDPPVRSMPPTSVVASNSMVGLGGVIEFSGTCSDDTFGTLFLRTTGMSAALIDTGVTGANWTYTWTAPTDPSQISSFTFEFWCGDPSGTDQIYPAALRRRVDMVASEPPVPPAADPAAVTLPETR